MADWADEKASEIFRAREFGSAEVAKALREARAEGMRAMRKRDEKLLGIHGYTGLLDRMDPNWQSGEESAAK